MNPLRAFTQQSRRKAITDREHKAILDACRARDPELCARLTRDHILEAATISVDVFRKKVAAEAAGR